MSHLRVVVGVPSGVHWHAQFGTSLVSLVAHFANKQVRGWKSQELRLVNTRGSLLPRQRLDILKAAKKMEATHLLFLDSDHTFHPDMLHRLLEWRKDVVGANCAIKQLPSQPTARVRGLDKGRGTPVYTDPNSHGLQEVWRIGTGVLLLSAKAFRLLQHDCFEMTYKAEVDDYQGEDWNMCETFERAGLPILIDHDVSRTIGHIGPLNYTHDMMGEIQDVGSARI